MLAESRFRPAWWLKNNHLQTIWPALFRRPKKIPLQWQTFDTGDGDFIDLVWTQANNGPIIILLHGLEGSIRSHYISGMLHRIETRGWQGVLMHFRGCSGRHNKLQCSYHSGETGDLRRLIQHLRQRHPERDLAVIGYSLGGNVLLKYLGEEKHRSTLKAAVAVSVPFELAKGSARLGQGISRLYQRRFIKSLTDKMRSKFQDRQVPFDLGQLDKWHTLPLFDHYVTARLHGFEGADDYYTKCSSRQFLPSIKTPTLIIHAADDPFIPAAAIPSPPELSPQVTLELTHAGGHVGFISGTSPFKPDYWLEKRIPAFLQEKLPSGAQK